MSEHTYSIPGVPGYETTKDGRVFSVTHDWRGYGKREMTQHSNVYGYLYVRLTVNGNRKKFYIHKLVAKTFVGDPGPDCDQLRHLDGDKTNNHYKNIKWGTAEDNARDRERHGNTSRGLSHSLAIKRGLQK